LRGTSIVIDRKRNYINICYLRNPKPAAAIVNASYWQHAEKKVIAT